MFSLKSLLLAVLVAAVYIVAFLNSSPIWASVIVTVTFLLLVTASVSIYLFPNNRPFLICAVIAGVIYGVIALVRPLGISDSLISTRLLFEWWLARQEESVEAMLQMHVSDRVDYFRLMVDQANWVGTLMSGDRIQSFMLTLQMGHCAIALILAVIAGLAGSYVARRRDVSARASHVQS